MSRVLPTATSRSPLTASASATEKRSSTVTTLPLIRIKCGGVVCPCAAPIHETNSQQSATMRRFIALLASLLERAHTHRIGTVALGHIALGDHLCFHRGIGRLAVVGIRSAVPEPVHGNCSIGTHARRRIRQRDETPPTGYSSAARPRTH